VKQIPIWDVFISHASEDKIAIARPLADALRTKGLRVWYDEFALKVGDSLRESIDHGLTNSHYGVVILSQNFFAKHWPQMELNGLATREVGQEKVILPVWYGVGFEDVRRYSPPLADRIAVSADKGLEPVLESLLRVLPISPHPPDVSSAYTAEYVRSLESLVLARTDQLQSITRELVGSRDLTLQALGSAIDLKTGGNDGHNRRVAGFTMAIARRLALPQEQMVESVRGAFLHNIGKLSIPDSILMKRVPLSIDEDKIFREYCHKGYLLLRRIPFFRESAEIVYAQEECFDGSGYPRGLKGTEIHVGARVFSIANALDTMISSPPEGEGKSILVARRNILKQSGIRFDPYIVRTFATIPIEFWAEFRNSMNSTKRDP
jgi:hypothetical protein